MAFSVSLPLRNSSELEARIAKGEILSRAALEAYIPTKEDYAKVRQWLVAQGLNVSIDADTRHSVVVHGSVATVSSAVKVKMARVSTPDGEFTSAVTTPELPDDIAVAVKSIKGLQPHLSRRVPRQSSSQQRVQINGNNYVTPAEVAAYYHADPTLTGTGQTIAIIADESPNQNDVTAFWNLCGITKQWDSDIQVIQVGSYDYKALRIADAIVGIQGDKREVTLDVEWASGIAPGAKFRIYEALPGMQFSSEEASYIAILNDLPANPSIRQVTESYGNLEPASVSLFARCDSLMSITG